MDSNGHISAIEAGSLGFLPRCFVLTSLPHSRPPTSQFVRVNGNVTVRMVTTSNLGLPYGVYPRKILISLTTEAVRTKSPVITLGRSMSSYLRSMGLNVSGGRFGSLRPFREQARRLFSTFISVEEAGERSLSVRNIVPVEDVDVWWEPQELQGDLIWEARITLSQKFFHQITENPVPLDCRVIQAVSPSPFAMDVYVWASYRRYKATRASLISWSSLQAQFGSGYPQTLKGQMNFRNNFLLAVKRVAAYDHEICRCLVPQGEGLLVKPGKPHVPIKAVWG